MPQPTYHLGDVVVLRKAHPCGCDHWTVIRMGADVRIKCNRCGHRVMLSRSELNRAIRKVESAAGSDLH